MALFLRGLHSPRELRACRVAVLACGTLLPVLLSGCGGQSGSTKTGTGSQSNTEVTILLSAAANDRLSQFEMNLQDLTLTSQSGKTVDLITTAPNTSSQYTPEFMHLNGSASTLLTTSVPQDTYTSASLTVGGASFTCIQLDTSDNSLTTSTFAYGQTPASQVTVSFARPIVVTGDTMSLSMTLNEAQSFTLGNCINSAGNTYSISPTFSVAAVDVSATPTNYLNGKESDVYGQVSASSANGLSVNLGYVQPGSVTTPQPVAIKTDGSTIFQGVANLGEIKSGMFVDMDLAMQGDGSLLATRVAVQDPSAVNTLAGPLEYVASTVSALSAFGQQVQGADQLGNTMQFGFDKATFEIDSGYTNLSDLPFAPSFTASTMVPGQYVYATFGHVAELGGQMTELNTVTLKPQTVDGTISAVSSLAGFDVYTVTLPSYDLFVNLASQPGQTSFVANPSVLQVYVGSQTQLLQQTSALTAGSTVRFQGLIFNDGGVLRMDCGLVMDGITE